MNTKPRHHFGLLLFLLSYVICRRAPAAESPAGKVVWWGKDHFWRESYSERTNGVIEDNDEIVGDAASVAANIWHGLVLKSDGTVLALGDNFGGVTDGAAELFHGD